MSEPEDFSLELLPSTSTQDLKIVSMDQIILSPFQPRKQFAAKDLEELADSLKSVGIIHPPSVRWNPERQAYELIAGERRWRAAQLAGFKTIPVLVKIIYILVGVSGLWVAFTGAKCCRSE